MEKQNKQNAEEEKWYTFWEQKGYFKADPNSSKEPYSLLMPPPNLTGSLHLGHAMQHAILDAIARFKRMQGYDVLLLPGVDHAGIQFEGTLDKLLAKEGLSKHKLGREAWLKRAWQFKEENYKSFHDTWKVFGLSADWDREVFTLDPKVQQAVLEEFQRFWAEGLLYKDAYIVQWCPKCGTAIEDVEMEYQEREEKLYYIKYPIEEMPGEFIMVATARPETIAADVAIAIYPKHPKYAKFVGKQAINPFTKTKLVIIEDKRIDPEFGTGALKVTPGHDMLDYQIGKDNNLPILHVVGKDGKITELDPALAGLKIDEARLKAAEILKLEGLIDKQEEYKHAVPVCERCKTTVEPLISEEWFVRMESLAQKTIEHIGEINFLPQQYDRILTDWLKQIHDWSISRSLWWGHRIPVWYCENDNPNRRVGKDQALVISLDKPSDSCPKCGKTDWVQDDQVLDTWFSSGMWPLATLGWPKESDEFNRYFPYDFEITAPEIKYLWIARMIMLSLHFADNIPFKNMFFHGMIRDLQGRKFSKSLGNGIDPNELRAQWGTDATRMALYSYAAPGRDGKASRQTMDERAKSFRNFSTKIRNITRFILELKPEDAASGFNPTHEDDKGILTELNKTVQQVTKNIEQFQLHLATEALYEFIWHTFADVYIEKSKSRRSEAQPVLEHVLTQVIIMLHPFMPFMSEEIYQQLPEHQESIMIASWPHSEKEA